MDKVNEATASAKKLISLYTKKFLKSHIDLSNELLASEEKNPISISEYNKNKYIENNSFVRISDEDVDELCYMVDKTINTLMPDDQKFDCTFVNFIHQTIKMLEENVDKIEPFEEKQKVGKFLEKWKNLYHGLTNCSYGIDSRLDGKVWWRNSELTIFEDFSIRDSNGNYVAKIGFDGTDKMILQNIKTVDDDFIATKMFFCKIYPSKYNDIKEEYTTILLKKIENGKVILKDIWKTNNIFPFDDNTNLYIETVSNINDYLVNIGFPYLLESYYDSYSLDRVLNVLNRYYKLTDEEKANIDNIANVAANWWASAIKEPLYDNGNLETSIKINAALNNLNVLKDEEINAFKNNLSNEIIACLIAEPSNLTLKVDYNPDIILSRAAHTSNISVLKYPIKTTMTITPELIIVTDVYGNKELLYDASKLTVTDDSFHR